MRFVGPRPAFLILMIDPIEDGDDMSSVPRLDAFHFYERDWNSYDELLETFEWNLPDRFNLADYVCGRWADEAKNRVMVFVEDETGGTDAITFWGMHRDANRLAHFLSETGIDRGDRVALSLPQTPETLLVHLAVWKLGAVSVPLSTLFGPDALEYRLADSGAAAGVFDISVIESVRGVREDLEGLETVLTVDADPRDDEFDLAEAIEGHPSHFDSAATAPEDNAIIHYTSGSTGPPKGVLHGHQYLLGHLPQALVGTLDMAVNPASDRFFTPSDWAWAGSLLMHVLVPLYYGIPVLAYRGQFEAETTLSLVDQYGITNCFFAPTVIRMLMQVDEAGRRYDLSSVRAIWSGGEAVGASIVEWAERTFPNATIHSSYGLTEAPGILYNSTFGGMRDGSTGRETPGHRVRVLDPETHEPLGPGEVGEIALRAEGDPQCFKEYWHRPDATAEALVDGWMLTNDLAKVDEDGYFWFEGRKDDVIISAGYRIGPEEIEDAVADHEAVQDAGVIGIPDELRGEIPKAFVQLAPGYDPSSSLTEDLQQFVKDRLAKHEYPRAIEYVDELPLTTTGKIQRFKLREREAS